MEVYRNSCELILVLFFFTLDVVLGPLKCYSKKHGVVVSHMIDSNLNLENSGLSKVLFCTTMPCTRGQSYANQAL